jgi:hypothetical protein
LPDLSNDGDEVSAEQPAAHKRFVACETCLHPFTCESGAFVCSDATLVESAAKVPSHKPNPPEERMKHRRDTLLHAPWGSTIRLVFEGSDVYRRVEIPRDANEVTLHVSDYSVQVIVDGKALPDE